MTKGKIHTEVDVEGTTIDQIIERAKQELDAFYDGDIYHITKIEAHPLVAQMSHVKVWSATVHAVNGEED